MRFSAVEIDLDKRRRLMLSVPALAMVERKVNEIRGSRPDQWVKFFDLLRSGVGFADLQALIWAALLHESPQLTYEQVGLMIATAEPKYLFDKLDEVIRVQFPADDGAASSANGGDKDSRPLDSGSTRFGRLPESS